jgi:DNA polymerase-1
MKRVHLIDGSGFIHRYYHAFPKLQRSDGLEVGAIRGFAEMLWRAVRVLDSTHVAVIMDAGRSGRIDIYPRYKSERKESDAELRLQIPMIAEACEAFGVATRRVEGYEADDVIATISVLVDEEMDQNPPSVTTIHSGDKDFYQLMSPTCRIFDPHPSRRRMLEMKDCMDRFGVHPHQVPCAQGLIGDSTDGIPGVLGIGKVAAAKLLNEFQDLDQVIEAALDNRIGRLLNKKQLASLLEPHEDEDGMTGIQLARLSRRLATLQIDVPLDFAFEDIVRRDPDEEKLSAWLKKMEFQGLASKIELQAA